MSAVQATTVAKNGFVDSFPERRADGAAGDAAADAPNDSACDGTERRYRRRHGCAEREADLGTSDDAGQRSRNATGRARDGSDGGACLLAGITTDRPRGTACRTGDAVR